MIKWLKKSAAVAFGIISSIFMFVPEAFFEKVMLLPEAIIKYSEWTQENASEISIIINRFLLFVIVWLITAGIYSLIICTRRKVKITGNNYSITVEYGDLLKSKKCKKVITFDECFSTNVGKAPGDINPDSICGKYLSANPGLDISSLLLKSQHKPLSSKSKYQKKDRYESGCLVPNGDDLLLAFAKLDKDGKGCLTREEYLQSLSTLWKEINLHYGQMDVCIPILGSGTTCIEGGSGASIPQQELLNMIIWSYKLSPYKIKAPNKLRIICKRKDDFSLDKIDTSK